MTLHEYRYFDGMKDAFIMFESLKEAEEAWEKAKEDELYIGQIRPLEERVVSTWRVVK